VKVFNVSCVFKHVQIKMFRIAFGATIVCGSKRDEVTWEYRRLHNKELYDLCSNIILVIQKKKSMRWVGYVARMGDRSGAYRGLAGKPERKRPPGRPRLRREGNIKMHLQEERWRSIDWIWLRVGIGCWLL
jgi:hypothetical protein